MVRIATSPIDIEDISMPPDDMTETPPTVPVGRRILRDAADVELDRQVAGLGEMQHHLHALALHERLLKPVSIR